VAKRKDVCKHPSELTKKQLENIVATIQGVLWADVAYNYPVESLPDGVLPDGDFWNPGKEWDSACDVAEAIADELIAYDLCPTEEGPIL
jgi:hypothetical protein